MIIMHKNKMPQIHHSAYIAPDATICGNVQIGENVRIMHHCSIIAEGGRIEIGRSCIVLENAVIRSTEKFSVTIGNHVLVGPHAHVAGCSLEDCVFIATGASIFHGARVGENSEVRINGVVHVNSVLAPNTTVPINWIAVGDPAQIFSPDQHDKIWAVQKPLNFPLSVYGIDRPKDGKTIMPEITEYYARLLGTHQDDEVMES